MTHHASAAAYTLSAMDLVVFGSLALCLAFFLAWLFSRDLRQWIEQPKHRFHANLISHDRSISDRTLYHQERGEPSK